MPAPAPALQLTLAESDDEIRAAFEVVRQLRTHFTSADQLLTQIRRQESQGYRLLCALRDGEVVGCAGFRRIESLFAGRYLYVDDLVTSEQERSTGVGKALLDYLTALGRDEGRGELHLDSGVQRKDAHRFYHRESLTIASFHFKKTIDPR
ncbi:MAG: GNAT family N-acetyltransferase [Deltaproteobacteria bacterium]